MTKLGQVRVERKRDPRPNNRFLYTLSTCDCLTFNLIQLMGRKEKGRKGEKEGKGMESNILSGFTVPSPVNTSHLEEEPLSQQANNVLRSPSSSSSFLSLSSPPLNLSPSSSSPPLLCCPIKNVIARKEKLLRFNPHFLSSQILTNSFNSFFSQKRISSFYLTLR